MTKAAAPQKDDATARLKLGSIVRKTARVVTSDTLHQDEQPGLFADGNPPPAPTGEDLDVLMELANGGFTQADWLRMNKGWRLAANIERLKKAGWPMVKTRITAGKRKGVVLYRLAPRGLRWVAMLKRQGVAA